MSPQITIKHNIGNTIAIPNELDIKAITYTADNSAAAATTIQADNGVEFSSGTILLLLSSMGAQNAEIVQSSAHTNTSFTIAAAQQPHTRGEAIQELNFDQISVYKSPTINGVYVLLTTQIYEVTQQRSVIFDPTGLSTDFYKVQWRNSISGNVSDFSDPISVDTYPEHSVASIVFPVLTAMGVSKEDPKINTEFLLSAADDARKFVEANLFGIRHAWREEFEFPIKLLAGTNFINLPSNIDFTKTDRSLLAARFLIGNILSPYNLRYIDKRTWNQVSLSVMGSTNPSAILIGAVSIVLENTGDLPVNGGVLYVATSAFSETIMQIQYTANNVTTNTLTGITGVTRNIPAGTQFWLTPTISQPIYYTVFDDKLVFDRIIPDSMQGNNVYIDFYTKLEKIVALYQLLPEPYREIYKWYLRYAVKYRKDINTPNDDPDLTKFEKLTQALFNNLYTGQDTTIITS